MEALESEISDTLKKYEAEGSSISQDLGSILKCYQTAKEGYQKGRKDRLNKEHQLCQLEKQVIALNNRLGKESSELLKSKEKLVELNSKLDANGEQIRKLDDEKTEAISKYNTEANAKKKLEDEKTSLVEILEAKSKELERVNEEWNLISNKLSEATKSNYEAQAKLDELMSGDVTREFKVKRLEQEKELLSSQNARLTTQLNGKIEELATLKKSKTTEVLDLQNLADSQKEQITQLTANCENFKETIKENEQRIDTLMKRLKRAREEVAETEGHMSKELSSKTKLVDLYKESSEEHKAKVQEMTSALLEMQKILKETDNEKSELEAKLDVKDKEYKDTMNDLEKKVMQLTSELDNANELLELARKKAPSLSKEELEGMSPTAAAASSLIRKGMTLSQIYNEYVEVSNSLEAEKDENTRLKQYMNQILQEIEEKAPVLHRQKENYEMALKTIENLTEKFEIATAECEKHRSKCEDAVREADFARRERDRVNTLCADLGQQVRVLVKEVEEARGGVVTTGHETQQMISSDTVSSSSQIISEHLVSFKNIEELQEQNQKLLAVVRDLSEEREKQEKECSPEKMTELAEKLDFAFQQLSQMKDERTRQDEIIQTLVKQRDMYKVLYHSEDRPEISSTTFMQESNQTASETSFELDRTKANLQRITDDYENHRKECKEKQSSLKEKTDKLEDEVSDLRRENQQMKGKLEFLEEKNDSMKSTNAAIKREADALTGKSRGLETALSKLQKEAAFYKQELEAANEKLINLEVNLKSSVTEKNLMKGTEQRLMQENKTLIEQQRSQNVLLTNLQTIQNNLERREFETRKALGQQVEQLQLEMKAIRRKLDSEEQDKKQSIGSLSSQLEQMRADLDGEKRLHTETKNSREDLKTQLDTALLQCKELKQLLESSESRLNAYLEDNEASSGDSVKLLKEQFEEKQKVLLSKVKEAESKVKALTSQVENANKHIDQYKQIASSCEEALTDANQKYAVLQAELNTKSKEMENKVSDLSKQLETKRTENVSQKSKSDKALQELQLAFDQLKKSHSTLKRDYDNIKGDIETFKSQSLAAKEEALNHSATATEKQEKYERELVLHAKDVEELVKAKEKLHEYEQIVSGSETRIQEAVKKVTAAETAMENMKIHCNEEVQKVTEHSKQLSEQNSLLHKEIEKLSAQIVDAKSQKIDLIAKLTDDGKPKEQQSTEDLYEVIRFIRREKEIAETKFEALQSENIRFRQRCEHFEKELEETQMALDLERKRTQGLMLSKEEHKELLSKVARVSELDVLNKDIQMQKDELHGENEALKAKMKESQKNITSLRDAKKILEEEKGSFTAEKTALKNEIQRWTTRVQQLLEQNNKANSELDELKNMQKSKVQNDKVMTALRDENGRLKSQKETMTREILKLKKDFVETQGKASLLTTLADTIKAEKEQLQKKLNDENETLQKQLDEKGETISEKEKLIIKLKNLARKYKSQCELLQKGKETSQVKEGTESSQDAVSADAKQNEELANQENKKLTEQVENLQSVQKENEQLKRDVEKLESSLKEAQLSIVNSNSKSNESVQKDAEMEKKITDLNKQIDNLTKQNASYKTAIQEKDDKEEQRRKLLKTAKEKINDLNVQRDNLATEIKELKNLIKEEEKKHQASVNEMKGKETLMNALKSQFEANIGKLKDEVDKLKIDNEKYVDHIKDLETEKRVAEEKSDELAKANAEKEEAIAKLKSQQVSVKPIQDFPTAEPAVLAPLTATVRPTASAVTNQSQKPMHSTRTASIRPLIPTVTPTAMVSPTVPPAHSSANQGVVPPSNRSVTVMVAPEQRTSEAQAGPSRGQASVFKAPRVLVTAQSQESAALSEVQATVAPIISASNAEEQPEDFEAAERVEDQRPSDQLDPSEIADIAESLSNDFVASSSVLNEAEQQERSGEHETRDNILQEPAMVTVVQLSPENRQLHQDDMSVAENSTVIATAQLKRRRSQGSSNEREDEVETNEEHEEKRQRMDKETGSQDDEAREAEVISISDGDVDDEDFEEGDEGDEYDDEDGASDENIEEVEDDSEVDDGENEEEEMFDYEESQEEEYEDDDNEVEEGDMEEGESDDGEMEEERDANEDDEDDNVMEGIDVGQSNSEQQESSDERRLRTNTSPITLREPNRDLQRRQPSPAALMLAAQEQGRGRVFRRRYQLPSFSLPPGQGGSGPFDEADDCTVPSTPTLYEPKRSDGFAEAVSSPQVRHPVFSFPAGSEGASRSQSVGLDTGINDEGLRLDDTRIDLLAGEEPASVPSTPLGIVPSVTVTPAEGVGDEVIVSRQSVIGGHSRHSSTARVPQLSTEDASQEQNVPQHIDLTGDDEEDNVDNDDVIDQNVLSVGPQEENDLFEDVSGQTGANVEDDSAIDQEQHAEGEPEEMEEHILNPPEQGQNEEKSEKGDDAAADIPSETTATAAAPAARARRGRRPRIRRTVLQARGQATDDKAEAADQ